MPRANNPWIKHVKSVAKKTGLGGPALLKEAKKTYKSGGGWNPFKPKDTMKLVIKQKQQQEPFLKQSDLKQLQSQELRKLMKNVRKVDKNIIQKVLQQRAAKQRYASLYNDSEKDFKKAVENVEILSKQLSLDPSPRSIKVNNAKLTAAFDAIYKFLYNTELGELKRMLQQHKRGTLMFDLLQTEINERQQQQQQQE